jgi:hypothetical protein
MRFLVFQTLFIVVVGLVLAQFLPWWSITFAGVLAGWLWCGHRGRSFFAGFLGGLLLWTGAALVIMLSTGSDFPDKFAKVMFLPPNGILLAIVAGVVAGLVAGIAAYTGDSLRRIRYKGA